MDPKYVIDRQGKTCECGCGQPAPVATRSDTRFGHRRGEPMRFVRGHANRRNIPDFLVIDRGYRTPCHIWNRGVDPATGYGRTSTGNDAHRRAYERRHGPVPAGKVVDHLCRQRDCVNEEHLEAVTPSINSLRGLTGRQPKLALRRLSPDDVIRIRASRESNRMLAAALGVSRETVRLARSGRQYEEVVV